MLEKPVLSEATIVDCSGERYGITVVALDFLPIGNDSSAWVYRVGGGEQDYFLKVKKGKIEPAGLLVARYLKDSGIEQVVAPLRSRAGDLWEKVEEFNLILYPFVEGRVGMEVGLADGQWRELGMVLRQIHGSELPAEMRAQVAKEDFVPVWSKMVRVIEERIGNGRFGNRQEEELASFWQERREEIGRIVARTEEIGRVLRGRPLEFVLCHADIHTANVLVDGDDLYIVDWDQPILAPKERDLMFVVGDGRGVSRQEALFFEGYGNVEIDWLTVAYYRYEWVVQELGDFGERVFFMPEVGAVTREDSVRGFRQLFRPGDVVEGAYQVEGMLKRENGFEKGNS